MPRRGLRAAPELGALGVVFGDIGTSPLYAVGLLFAHRVMAPTNDEVLGGISLILWTLTLVVAFKYAFLVLRADNDGEGGLVGSVLGAAAARKLSASKGRLNAVFAALIVIVAGYMFYRNWMAFQS